MASSVPAQVMYPPPPPPSFGGAHTHNPSHHASQPSHFAHHPQPSPSSSSSYHAHPQAQSQHHQHHASSLPPPPPSGQHFQGYATQYPSHSHEPPTHHQYTQDRPQERLPSIRDLDFQFHQQQVAQAQSSQHQQQGQQQQSQSSQQQGSQQHQQPTGSSSGGGPGASTSASASGSTIQPGSLVISPTRQRRHWGASASAATAGPSQSQSNSHHLSHSQSHQQVPPQALPHSQHSHLVSSSSAPASSSVSASASSSFVAPPPTLASGQSSQYHTGSSASRRPRSESLAGGGSRGSIGSIGSNTSLPGAASGPTSGLSGGPGSGGMNAPITSPVTRSPLAVPPYGHNAGSNSGYAPPPTSSMGAASIPSASSMTGSGNAGVPLGSSTASVSGRSGANPHSPYGTTFPSPHSPHLHLHTPLSQAHGPSTSTSGAGASTGGMTSGGTQGYARQEYVQYDYSAGYTPSAGAGPSTGGTGAPPIPGEQHAYSGRGIPQGQILYSGLPPSHPSHHAPPTQEPWPTQTQLHQTHQPTQLATYHAHTQHQPQHQPQHQTYPRSPSGSSSLVGTISGSYGAPLSSQQAHEHGHMVSPGLTEHDPGPSGHAGGVPLALPGGGAGVPVPGSARAHFLPKIQEQCCILYDFARRYTNSSVQPSQAEVEHMSRIAADMIALLSEYRRAALAEGAIGAPPLHHPYPYVHSHPYSHAYPGGSGVGLPSPAPEESNRDRMSAGIRAPKRPWEDVAQESDEDAFGPESVSAPPPGSLKRESISTGQMLAGIAGRDPEMGKGRTAAEKDMELIRSKRATNVGTLGPGAPKGKYRKRSRATPPGKCHSCNIRETPEWRRGPDGARTLCNACGLHYAKLIRKRDKQAAASADGPQARIEIDMETLRASTRAASEREQIKAERERERQREREKAATAAAEGEGMEGKAEQGVQRGSLGLGLETGLNGFSSGEDVKENGVPDIAPSVLNEHANAISTPVAVGDTSSNVSTGSNGLQESWHPYADADLAQSSFLRGVPTAATVRPTSS